MVALRKTLKGLSKEDEDIIKQKPLFDTEELIIDDLKNELARVTEIIEPLEQETFGEGVGEKSDDEEIHNAELIKKIREQFSQKFREVNKQIRTLAQLVAPSALKSIDDAVKEWNQEKEDFEKKYEAAKKASECK